MKNLSATDKEKIEELLSSVVKHFDSEDRIVREYQLRKIRRLKLYWNSFSQIYWSETARDYRIFGNDPASDDSGDQAYYDKPINVFRAFLETIIAAMSIQIPAARCVPDDADNPNDIATAKAGNVISELLYKHNDVLYLWLYSLYVHMTEGMVACYSYVKEDKAYGTYQQKKYKDEEVEAYQCDACGQVLPEEMFEDVKETELNEFQPDDDDISLHAELNDNKNICPNCAALLDPDLQKKKVTIPKFVGMTDKPKSRVCFKVKGGMYVKIAVYARELCESPYLIDSYETHYANVLQMYPKLWDEIPHGGYSSTGVNEPYEWWVRINPQYRNAFPEEVVTVKSAWLRPAAFNILDEDDAKYLKKHFPDGARVIMANEYVADYCNESLDDCWTVTRNPMFDYLTHEPLGELLVNIQDITNDLISLTLQTIEHGIPQTWVDPAFVDLNAYRQVEAMPGAITPIKNGSTGKNISDGFHTTTTSSLAPEVIPFYQIIQQLGQFVSGAMPAIYGGQMSQGSSRTASEYAMARTNALQRLSTPWRMFTLWWKDIMGKGIPAYMKVVQEDERLVKKDPNGNYVNVWIRKTDLVGKIGDVELENSEQMPVSDDQKADIIMRLMELNNMEVMQALTIPENLPFIRKIVKIPEFKLPGEDDRNKQYEEINQLLNSEPIVLPQDPIIEGVAAQQGMAAPEPEEMPSVEVDPFLDNHAIEGEICRSWLISDAGRLAKIEQPLGYKNVLLHYKQHIQLLAQSQMANQAMQTDSGQGSQPAKPDGESNPDTPIEENKDARTPVH